MYLIEQGIEHQFAVLYTPEQNGIVERKNCSLAEMCRSVLLEADLSEEYRGEAMNTATYLQNRLPTKGAKNTLYELWYGQKPSMKHLRVFGSKAFAYIPKEKQSKLDLRSKQSIFIGYALGYRILDLKTQTVKICNAVFIDEKEKFKTAENVDVIESTLMELNKVQESEAEFLSTMNQMGIENNRSDDQLEPTKMYH